MKIVKAVVKVIAIVATIAAFIPGPHQALAAVIAKVATVASAALEVAVPTRRSRPNARGSPTEYRLDPQSGIPYLMGRTQYAGTGIKRETWGKDNAYQSFTSVYSYGPIQTFLSFTLDRAAQAYNNTTGAFSGGLSGWAWFKQQIGAQPSPVLTTPVAGMPGWDAASQLSGLAASHLVLKFDKKGKKFTGGPPTPGVVVEGVLVYDPRLDSTQPGGVGACRALNEATYVYSETPHLHALTYALGRYQNGKRRFGIGFPPSSIDMSYFKNAANVDESNGWKVGGLIMSNDSKWNTLKQIMEAGGGQPITLGAKLSGMQSAPRVSVATIGEDDVVGRVSIVATRSQRNRINSGVPRYRSEAHGWEYISASPVRIQSYITMDGRERTQEYEWTHVQQLNQAAQLTHYEIMNAREFGPIEQQLKIRWVGLKPGDCVILNQPKYNLVNQRAVVIGRSFDVQTGSVVLRFQTEDNAKHAAALAATGTAPPVQSLGYDPDAVPPAPTAWTLTTGGLATSGGTVPTLRFNGFVDNDSAATVEFSYRKSTDVDWTVAGSGTAETIRFDEAAVAPGQAYYGRVRYFVNEKASLEQVLGPITVENIVASTATIANSIVGQSAFATDPRSPNALFDPRANILVNGGFRLRLDRWTGAAEWWWTAGASEGAFIYTQTNGTFVRMSAAFPVAPGYVYSLQAELTHQGSTGTIEVDIQWYQDAAGTVPTATGSDGVGVSVGPGTGWTRLRTPATAPAGAVSAKVRAFSAGVTFVGQVGAIRRIKVSRDDIDVPFTDEATSGSLYNDGVAIEVLRPAEVGATLGAFFGGNLRETSGGVLATVAAYRTGDGVAAAVTGQTGWATYSGGDTPAAYALRTQRLQTDGYIQDISIYRPGSAFLSDRWPAEAGANVTENRTSAGFLNQGVLATRSVVGASLIEQGETANIVPDGNYNDVDFWNIGTGGQGSLVTLDAAWNSQRGLLFACTADFEYYSDYFQLEVGAVYRVKTRIWNNGGVTTGYFQPMLHLPNVAWWSLKHGYSVTPGVADAANAIVAAGDTFDLTHYFRCTGAGMRQIQFRFLSTMRGSPIQMFVSITKVPQVGVDLLRNASIVAFTTAELETSQGQAASIAGQAATATNSDFAAVTGATRPEANADVTSLVVVVEDPAVVQADHTGVIKTGQLPKNLAARLVRNGANITSGITWTYRVIYGTVNGNTSASGNIAVTGGGLVNFDVTTMTVSSKIEWKAVYAGTTRIYPLEINIVKDLAPVGGSGGGTTTSLSTISSTGSGTSYGSSDNLLPRVKTGSAGTLTLSAPLSFNIGGLAAGSLFAYGKWQWRAIGGSYADVAVEIVAASEAFSEGEGIKYPGDIAVSQTKTGLTANTEYEVQLQLRDNHATRSASFTGTATAVGS